MPQRRAREQQQELREEQLKAAAAAHAERLRTVRFPLFFFFRGCLFAPTVAQGKHQADPLMHFQAAQEAPDPKARFAAEARQQVCQTPVCNTSLMNAAM